MGKVTNTITNTITILDTNLKWDCLNVIYNVFCSSRVLLRQHAAALRRKSQQIQEELVRLYNSLTFLLEVKYISACLACYINFLRQLTFRACSPSYPLSKKVMMKLLPLILLVEATDSKCSVAQIVCLVAPGNAETWL